MDPLPTGEDAVEAWVDRQLAADPPPRRATWRYHALGTTKATAIADAPVYRKLDLDVPSRELEIVRWAAGRHGWPLRTYLRAALAHAVRNEGVDMRDYPYLDASPRLPWR